VTGDLDAAVEAALVALEAAGVPRDRALVGVTDAPVRDADTWYATHVGATHDTDTAMMLHYVAREAEREADRAAQALYRGTPCPNCSSPRYALKRETDDSGSRYRILLFDECMDCEHKVAREPRRG
jgi:hypothetical protein